MKFSALLSNVCSSSGRKRGHQLVALRDLLAARATLATLPRHKVAFAEIPGVPADACCRGGAFLPPE
jgi:hypothetical protein